MCLLDRFCSCNYLCVVRLFAESILRYGLSPSFLIRKMMLVWSNKGATHSGHKSIVHVMNMIVLCHCLARKVIKKN
ncbi:hypothetical protein AAZX31_13G041300 [Glycine max]